MRKANRDAAQKRREKSAASERQTLQLLELHPRFDAWIEWMRKKHEIEPTQEEGVNAFEAWVAMTEEAGLFLLDGVYDDITRFCRQFGLPENYTEALSYYVVTGSFKDARTSKIAVTIDSHRRKWVNLKIYAHASPTEIADAAAWGYQMLNRQLKRGVNGKMELLETNEWHGWKYRPQLEKYLEAYRASQSKEKRSVTDKMLVAELYPDEDEGLDFKNTAEIDEKRAKQLHVIRRRVDKALHERFPANTF